MPWGMMSTESVVERGPAQEMGCQSPRQAPAVHGPEPRVPKDLQRVPQH